MSGKNKTIVAILLDETGSMQMIKPQTINSYNEYIQSLQKSKDTISITLTRFNSDTGVKIDYVDREPKDVELLNDKTYLPNALTPLYDAIGKTVREIEKKETKQSKMLIAILTDGQENASMEFKKEAIVSLIKEKETKGNWTFVYLGAGQNSWTAWEQARAMGLSKGNVMSFKSADIGKTMAGFASATRSYAQSAERQTKKFFKE